MTALPFPAWQRWAALAAPLLLGALALQFNLLPAGALEKISYGFERRGLQLAAILVGALGMVVLGWLDDKHELRAGPKFATQLSIALLVALAGVRIKLFPQHPLSPLLSYEIGRASCRERV